MNERVIKEAIEYIANKYSANTQMLECNPRTAITISECQRLMVGFSVQESKKAIDLYRKHLKQAIKSEPVPIEKWSVEKIIQLIDTVE